MPVINSYEQYPEVTKKINKAIGGKNGRMPKWFEHSKNARHASSNGKKKHFKKANDSIMNRIDERFEHVGNMNMNYAGIAPFNYEMLLDVPVNNYDDAALQTFCEMDNTNISNLIESSDLNDVYEREIISGYDSLCDQIVEVLKDKYGTLENVYPSIVQGLYTGPALDKQSHKQMFWRVFGDIAIDRLERNLVACRICPKCGMHVPIWTKHECTAPQKKMFVCQDCGKTVERTNSRCIRCPDCQSVYRKKREADRIRTLRAKSAQN